MSYMDKGIKELHEMLVKGEVTSDELVKEALEPSKKEAKEETVETTEE